VGFAPLSNEGTSLSSSFHRPRSVRFPTASLEIRQGVPLIPFHRLHPRRPPSRGVATTSDSSSKLESRSDLVVSHDFVGFLRRLLGFSPGCSSPFRATKDLRACCVPLPIVGFDAFLPPHPVEPAPGAVSLLTPFPCWSLGFAVPRIEVRTPRRIPPACSRSTSPWSLPPRTFRRLRSATFPMSPFPFSSLLSYRRDLVPRGFAPLAGPYHRVPLPVFVGLPSLGLVPLRGYLQVIPFGLTELRRCPASPLFRVLRTVAIAFVPSFFPRLWAGETRSVPCPVPVRSRPEFPREIRRFPRRAATSCDAAAQVGRFPVAFFDIAVGENFGLAEHRPVSFSRTDRRRSLLVWCSFGHHLLRSPRGVRPKPITPAKGGHWVLREGIISIDSLRFRSDDPYSPGRFRRVS